jgi:hypothetical protein
MDECRPATNARACCVDIYRCPGPVLMTSAVEAQQEAGYHAAAGDKCFILLIRVRVIYLIAGLNRCLSQIYSCLVSTELK